MNLIRSTEVNELVPKEFYLVQNYPNPFKDKTTIKYCVAYKINVKLTVYDSEGEVIRILVDEEKKPGTYEVEFSVESLSDASLKNNTYYYCLEAGQYKSKKRMEIIK